MDSRNGNKDNIVSFHQFFCDGVNTNATFGSMLLCLETVHHFFWAVPVPKNFLYLDICFVDQVSLLGVIWIIDLVPQDNNRNGLFTVIVFLDKLQQPDL